VLPIGLPASWAPAHWLYAGEDFLEPTQTRFTYLAGRAGYEFALAAYGSEWEALRASWDYLLPVLWAPVKPSRGRLPLSAGFLSVEPEQVLLTALFASAQRAGRREEGIYARLWNASSRRQRAVLRSGGRVRTLPCNLDLSPADEDEQGGGALSLRPWGIQTVRIAGLKVGRQLT